MADGTLARGALLLEGVLLAERERLPGFEPVLLGASTWTPPLLQHALHRLPDLLGHVDAELYAQLARLGPTAFPQTEHSGEVHMDAVFARWCQATQSKRSRKLSGSHFTPATLAQSIAQRTLQLQPSSEPSVCDPSVGTGSFLLAVFRQLKASLGSERAMALVHGTDIDPNAVLTAQLRLWLEARGLAFPMYLKVGDATLGRPAQGHDDGFDWPSTFPHIFTRDNPGFDIVLANPPFLNAIQNKAARDRVRDYYRVNYTDFAQGAYDLYHIFWQRILRDLLRRGGHYAILSPTVALSDERAWKAWIHEHFRPSVLTLLPVDFFPEARIRTSVFLGSTSPARTCLVENYDPKVEAPTTRSYEWSSDLNWFAQCSGQALDIRAPTLPLESMGGVRAGATTQEAYVLASVLELDRSLQGKKLVTTGLLDRYRNKWGTQPTRFLGRDYSHPRWPVQHPQLARCLEGQNQSKIIVGGLTAVIEAWLDHDNEAAGVVQTWIILPQRPSDSWWLTSLLNSAIFSRLFVRRHGAEAMTGRQITIRKKALLTMPIPEAGPCRTGLGQVCEQLMVQQKTVHLWDKLGHFLASRAYGRSASEAEEDYLWWCRRVRQVPEPTPVVCSLGRVKVGSAEVQA